MKIAVVGLGYWGPNLVRNLRAVEGVTGIVGVDNIRSRVDRMSKMYNDFEPAASYDDVLTRSDIDAVVIATPVSTHFPLGMKALQAGKHVLIEKPMTLRAADAEELVRFADREGLRLMVDHTFVYTSAVRTIKRHLTEGKIGDILYFDSVRVNLGLFQHDTNVVWDLAPHDLSIMGFLIGKMPLSVSSVGVSHFNGHEDVAYITVVFPGNIIAHFHVNWISPVKVRKVLIGGTKLMVVYDDMEPSEKVKMYDRGVEVKEKESEYRALIEYRVGDMFAPHVAQTEALSLMANDFVNFIKTGNEPDSSATAGLNVVRVLEAADQSMKSGGQIVTFSGNGEASGHLKEHLRQVEGKVA